MKKESFLGVDVSPFTYDQIINELQNRIERKEQSTIIAVNPEKVMTAQKNEQLKRLINHSTFQIPDGIGIVLASKLRKGQVKDRVTGVDMMERLLQLSEEQKHPVFLYGAKSDVVQQAADNIQKKYPGIQIAGVMDGYEKDEEKIIQAIQASGARLLFVALGSPTQELFIERNLALLPNVYVFQGVGGSFDVMSGNVKRAPLWTRKLGLEWLYRLLSNPSRFKRQLKLPQFLISIWREKK